MKNKTSIFVSASILIVLCVCLSLSSNAFDCGDVNSDGIINVFDITYTISYLYLGGPAPPQPNLADVDSSGVINIFDITFLIAHLYLNGPTPSCSPQLNEPIGSIVDVADCMGMGKSRGKAAPDEDCIEFNYDGESKLNLKHINAGFNCCPLEVIADISIDGNLITITEDEIYDTLGPCACLCLFDVEYEIINLPPGNYDIKVFGMYLWEDDDSLVFSVNLGATPSGEYCVTRDHYPWGYEFNLPSGNMVEHSGCLYWSAKDSLEEDCITYEYDNGTLLLTHLNDLFNCCPESLLADIDINTDSNVITITETEDLGQSGGCDCLCLYNLDYVLVNIPPGEYTIKVDNPYYYYWYGNSEFIEFTVNLATNPSGYFCVDRNYLPWYGGKALRIDSKWIDPGK